MTDIVTAIVTCPAKSKSFYISHKVQLLVFQSRRSNLDELVGSNDCIVLIPVAITGSPLATVTDGASGQSTTITFTENSEVMVTRRGTIGMLEESKVVCVVLCISGNKGKDKG